MKKLILLIFLVPTLIIAASSKSYSQTSDSTTAPAQTETATVDKNKTVPFLIEQIKNERELNRAKDGRITDLENEVTLERENSTSIKKSYDASVSENANLKSANESLHEADNLNKQTVALLQTDNVKQKEKAKKATKAKWKAYGIAAVTILVTYVLH